MEAAAVTGGAAALNLSSSYCPGAAFISAGASSVRPKEAAFSCRASAVRVGASVAPMEQSPSELVKQLAVI